MATTKMSPSSPWKRQSISAAGNFTLTTVTGSRSIPIPEAWNLLVPAYKSQVIGPLVISLVWDPKYAKSIMKISLRRVGNRIANYVDPFEIRRVKEKLASKREASIRFGAEKKGHGYNGERGDFCLVGGVIRGKDLSVFYRSLEMIGGFAYDLTLMHWLTEALGLELKTVTIYTTKAFVFALKGNSNEKLFPKLQEIFQT